MKKIKNPHMFQGSLNKRNYFEGWYYKQVSIEDDKTISFIPGISLNEEDSHAFVQVIVSAPIKTYYFRYKIEDFEVQNKPFRVKVGQNYFSESSLSVNLKDDENTIKGRVDFGSLTPLMSSFIMPNIMGYFAYIPNMKCNHGVVSMTHTVNGQLEVNNSSINFTSDKGYIEKDWGTSFPEKYIWMQGNHFNDRNDSFMLSVAKVPMLGFSFMGLIANVLFDNVEYRIATYNGGRVKTIKLRDDGVDIMLTRKDLELKINAYMQDGGELLAPVKGKMKDIIKEGLGGRVNLTLKKNGKIIKSHETEYAGIEIVGKF